MSEIIDHRCYSYGHGIISQDCLARQYSDTVFSIKFVHTGTFVQVHSVQDDDVLFRIVHDDMHMEKNQMICKQSDIINVPENLWGPLFTVEKVARLSLVRDSKVAESIGNISVGHTVQVLGPENSVICSASVTFRNCIERLGVGIYFGLRVLNPRENLQTIIEKVSLLGPGTKGFPRGCDLVVTIDKIFPSDFNLTKEKLTYYCEKEIKKPLMKSLCCGEDINSANFKSVINYNLKDKQLNTCKKEKQTRSPEMDSNTNQGCFKEIMNTDNPLHVEDEVVYLDGDTPERGVVKWIGLIENSVKVGVEFDNPISGSTGIPDGLVELFRKKNRHGLIVPPTALIKLSDYLLNSSNGTVLSKKNSNNNNNKNNNNNNINSNNNLIANINNNNNNNNNSCNQINNNDDYFRSSELCWDRKQNNEDSNKKSKKVLVSHQYLKHSEKFFEMNDCFFDLNKEKVLEEKNHKSVGVSESGWQPISKSFDCSEPSERKISYKRNCNSIDNGLIQKETNLCPKVQNPKSLSRLNCSSHDVCHLVPKQEKSHRNNFCKGKKLQKCFGQGDDDSAFFENDSAHSTVKNSTAFLEKDLAKKSSRGTNSDELYDVPSGIIRKVPGFEDSSVNRFYTSTDLHKQDKWGSHHSEHSSSDENLAEYCDPPKPSHSSACYPEDLGKGSVVELTFEGESHYGVIRWIGTFPDDREDSTPVLIAGIEMEEEYPGFTDGTFKNKRYFTCNPKKALFVPLSKCRKDSRFSEDSQKQNVPSKVNYGQIDCPIVEGTIPPICHRKNDIESICGKNRGIQGHHNSCYLDATLFAMFAFTSAFDSLLYRPPTKNDIPQYIEVQRVLRDEIVNPLRKNLYVRADRVMKLRRLLEELSSVSGLTSEEKDPEEFLNSLLAQILKAEPFLKLSSGQEAFHYQLFVEKDERLVLPTVQQLFEQSFLTSDIKLKEVPSCLIIQMPRFGKSFKMYSKILPPQLLDVTDIIENSPRQCTVCGKLAEYECKDCFGQQGIGFGLESISYCKTCLDTAHNHHCRIRHNSRALTVPVEFYELQEHCIIPRQYMELFAVVCIETSHYVAFVKCGSGSDAPWCFFDSMADRKGEQNGYNIPEMVPCPDLPYWLSEEGAKALNEMRDERQLTEHVKRLFSDAYMCMYQSPNLMMYR